MTFNWTLVLETKLLKLATVLGKDRIKELGFE